MTTRRRPVGHDEIGALFAARVNPGSGQGVISSSPRRPLRVYRGEKCPVCGVHVWGLWSATTRGNRGKWLTACLWCWEDIDGYAFTPTERV